MILKLKRTPGIYLVGFMGSGKSTVGRALADELGWNFFDLDEDIERRQGTAISQIFETQGEPEFRRLESEALWDRVQSVQAGRPQVIALGGGAFLSQENFELVSSNGISLWLDCPWEMIERRTAGQNHRPLARDRDRFRELFQSRLSAYARADYTVQVRDDDPRSALAQILTLPLF
jgi:shikimate kinase